MIELFRRLLIRPALFTELVLASLLANVLALATPLFVIQVLNRYVANGVDATLMTLASGTLIAVVLEFGFRQVRNKLAKGVSAKPDEQLSLAGFGVLTNAKAGLLERLPPGQQREIMNGIDNIKNTSLIRSKDWIKICFLFISPLIRWIKMVRLNLTQIAKKMVEPLQIGVSTRIWPP